MKKILCILFILLTGCRSFDVLQAGIPMSDPAVNRLPHLDIVIPKAKSGAEQIAFEYYRRMFEDNLMLTTGNIQGSVEILPRFQLDKSEKGWQTLSWMTLGILNLIGFPTASWTGKTVLEVQLKNMKKEIVGKFYANVEYTEYVALYHYNNEDAKKAAYLKSFSKAIDFIAVQVKQAKNINF